MWNKLNLSELTKNRKFCTTEIEILSGQINHQDKLNLKLMCLLYSSESG